MRDEINLDEISTHVKNLQSGKKESNSISKLMDEDESTNELGRWEEISKEDIFEIVKPSEEEIITSMDINLDKRRCDMCKKTINLENNLSGIVVHDTHFLCEDCCSNSSKAELDSWMHTRMANPGDLKPVALWLMKEKNKTKMF